MPIRHEVRDAVNGSDSDDEFFEVAYMFPWCGYRRMQTQPSKRGTEVTQGCESDSMEVFPGRVHQGDPSEPIPNSELGLPDGDRLDEDESDLPNYFGRGVRPQHQLRGPPVFASLNCRRPSTLEHLGCSRTQSGSPRHNALLSELLPFLIPHMPPPQIRNVPHTITGARGVRVSVQTSRFKVFTTFTSVAHDRAPHKIAVTQRAQRPAQTTSRWGLVLP
ncbi:hypothetical protein ON010_g5247 [Phytophthora cinnamomi]|nr:hypothetical protein ON010_g5247 [Phytophthora cinnamomi]